MQQNLPRQWQLRPDVLRPWLQPVHGEAGGALPLQVPLVLLRHLQEVWADRGEIRLQMSRPHQRLQINQSTTVPRRLTSVLSFSMCIATRQEVVYSCLSIVFVSNLKTASWASQLFCFTNLDVESVVTVPVVSRKGPPSSWVFSLLLLMIINFPNRDIESLFYYISIKNN